MSAAAAAIIGGGAIKAVSAYKQGKALQKIFNAQAAQEDIQAARALKKGVFDSTQIKRTGERVAGAQKAAIGGSGITSSGSLLNVMVDQAIETDFEARVAIFNSQAESRDAAARADILRQQGEAAREGGELGAVGGALDVLGKIL